MTDAKRLRQITKCLLSNAFKFTESGRVSVRVAMRDAGWSPTRERLNGAHGVVAFAVTDTGVGMSESEQRSILEVFPPERIEARRGAGASGLGMAISRELARLLGGDLRVESVVGSGSTFTLYLPTCGLVDRHDDRASRGERSAGTRRRRAGNARVSVPARGTCRPPALGQPRGRSRAGAELATPPARQSDRVRGAR